MSRAQTWDVSSEIGSKVARDLRLCKNRVSCRDSGDAAEGFYRSGGRAGELA